jgi:hypothetical protein
MGDAVGDDARLARAGTGQNQDRSIDLLDGFSLLRIEFTEVQLSQFTGGDSSRESRHLRGFHDNSLDSVPTNTKIHTKVMQIP